MTHRPEAPMVRRADANGLGILTTNGRAFSPSTISKSGPQAGGLGWVNCWPVGPTSD